MLDPGPFDTPVTLASGICVAQRDTGDCFLDFVAGGPVLVVGFEGAGPQRERPDGRRDGWGQGFVLKAGHSLLSVKPKRVDWYRTPALHAFLRSDAFGVWLRQFDRVMLFGTSMGGFAALAFAEVFPGATVIAHNPQSTLAPDRVPWETRFHEARALDWSGDFVDGADAGRHAARVWITFDPFHRLDRFHVERIRGASVQAMRVPFVGHGVPEWLNRMGVLRKLTLRMIDGTLAPIDFARAVRRRRTLARYFVRVAEHTRSAAVRAWALGEAARIEPANGELIGREIVEGVRAGDFPAAIAAHARAPALAGLPNAKRPEALAALALAHLRTGDPDRADALAREAEALAAESVGALLLLAELRLARGEKEPAVAHLRRVLLLSPGQAQAARLLAATSADGAWAAADSARMHAPPPG